MTFEKLISNIHIVSLWVAIAFIVVTVARVAVVAIIATKPKFKEDAERAMRLALSSTGWAVLALIVWWVTK